MDEATLHSILVWVMFGLAGVTLAVLAVLTAPYGRHQRGGFGPGIPSRAAWVIMEAPAALAYLAIYAQGDHRLEAVPLFLLGLWQLHYLHRTFIFPFRLRVRGKTMPLAVMLSGVAFNGLNAYVNARWISHFGSYSTAWLTDPRLVAGVALFLVGWGVNFRADTILLGLRRPGESGYTLPPGPLFRLVTCPNYLGEIVEWLGWAVATWSLAGLSFAVYTIANLAPRALAHRRWYREQFPDYPPDRKALVPFIL